MPLARDVTPEEIELCLEAIAQHPKGAAEVTRPPGEAYSIRTPTERYIYINFVRPADLPLGAVYRTWIVQIGSEGAARILYFRSRRGAAGDDTLPEDD